MALLWPIKATHKKHLISLKSEAEREEIAEAERKAKKRRLLGMGLAGGC